MVKHIEITKIKSTISCSQSQIKVVRALGLYKVGDKRLHKDNNCIRGMLNKVKHLLAYRFID